MTIRHKDLITKAGMASLISIIQKLEIWQDKYDTFERLGEIGHLIQAGKAQLVEAQINLLVGMMKKD